MSEGATKTLAWHWTDGAKLRDGRTFEAGETITHDGPLCICQSGLHASEDILDALAYAPGFTVSRVECAEIGERHHDKFVCLERTALWSFDAKAVVLYAARVFALEVAHLWPDDARMAISARWLLRQGEATAGLAAARAARAAGDAANRRQSERLVGWIEQARDGWTPPKRITYATIENDDARKAARKWTAK